MSNKSSRFLAVLVVIVVLLSTMAGCGQSGNQQQATTLDSSQATTQAPVEKQKEIVTLNSIYPGDEPKFIGEVLPEVNKKLEQDIGAKLELTWAPWDQYNNKIELSVAAGEKIDYMWNGSSFLAGYVAKKLVAPIDNQMEKYGKPVYDNIDEKLFASMKIDGKLMGIPSTGNSPISDVYNVLQYREDLRLKYELPKLNTIANVELFLKTMKEKEPTLIPLCANNAAYIIMKIYGDEAFLSGTQVCGFRINADNSVTVMPIQEAASFKRSVAKVSEWNKAGYIPQDILNIGGIQNKMDAGGAAAIGGAALTASEHQSLIAANVPSAVLADQAYHGLKKYLNGNGGNAMYLSATSKYPEQVVQFWSWVFTNQENFDLYCYGVKDVNYTLKNDRIVFNADKSYADFPAWMFKNMNYLRFPEGMTQDYIDGIKHWDDGAELVPFFGFSFNPEKVSTELSQCKAVFLAYSPSLYTGMGDTNKLLAELDTKLKAAGQDKVVAEAQAQINAYMNSKQ